MAPLKFSGVSLSDRRSVAPPLKIITVESDAVLWEPSGVAMRLRNT
jgi:hypothetical protein